MLALRRLLLAAAAGAAAGALNVSLSPGCAAAVATHLAGAPACGIPSATLLSPPSIGACLGGDLPALAGRCGLADAVAALQSATDAAPPQACPLCNPLGADADCVAALDGAVAGALAGDGGALASACGASASDVLGLTLLRDQGLVTCHATAAAVPWRAVGRLGTRYLTQCSACGMLRCPPGHVCAPGSAPAVCPAGFFCPGGSAQVTCPEGHYCPLRSSAPLRCRGIAHCPAGAYRENLWVPLFVCLALLVGTYVGRDAVRSAATRRPVGSWGWLQARARGWRGAAAPGEDGAAKAPPSPLDHSPQPSPRGLPTGALSTFGGGGAPRLRLDFSDLRLTTRGNVRMDGVSGCIRAGRITAIMGGSGAGKTTLTSLLLGKETPTGGSVTVTVAPPSRPADAPAAAAPAFAPFTTSVSAIRNAVGFVPQVDCLPRELTVRQAVAHAAFTRLPAAWPAPAKAAHVERVLGDMGLLGAADSVIAAVSGGELKRTNMAVELAAAPSLLFLDEPTTGADATSAFRALELLQRSVRREGITVAAIIHQPREEILGLVDDLVLLGRGGRPVYVGPMRRAAQYFADVLGYACPPDVNPADFMMDVLEARYGAKGAAAAAPGGGDDGGVAVGGDADAVATSSAHIAAAFADAWRARGAAWVAALPEVAAAAAVAAPGDSGAPTPTPAAAAPTRAALAAVAPARPSFLAQTYHFTARAALQTVMGGGLLLDMASLLLGGCVMGIVASHGSTYIPPIDTLYANSCPPGAERLCRYQIRVHLEPVTFYTVICVGVLTLPVAVRALGLERDVFWREASSGVNRLSYYVGKVLALAPVLALGAFCFVAPLVAISHWRAPVETLFFAVLVLMWFIGGMGFAISALLPSPDAANLLGVNAAVIGCLFSGFVPMLGDNAVWAYSRWAQRALLAIELVDGWGLETTPRPGAKLSVYDLSMFTKEHRGPDWRRDLWILGVIAALTYALGFVALALRHRDKQR